MQSVVLPRTAAQRAQLRGVEGFTVPERAIDAQSLIAFADLVISAGGTMNREAVALGTPVYTTFEGRLGAVDERLIGEGRLRKLDAVEQLDLAKRDPSARPIAMRRDPRRLVELLLSPTFSLEALESRPMRRRISAPALSLTRHSLPRLALDGALVALAYWLAWELRFDNGQTGPTRGRYEKLFERTVWWVLGGSLVVLLLSRVYQRRWRYSGQRDYEAVARAVLAIVLLTVVGVAVVRPVQIPHLLAHHGDGRRSARASSAQPLSSFPTA